MPKKVLQNFSGTVINLCWLQKPLVELGLLSGPEWLVVSPPCIELQSNWTLLRETQKLWIIWVVVFCPRFTFGSHDLFSHTRNMWISHSQHFIESWACFQTTPSSSDELECRCNQREIGQAFKSCYREMQAKIYITQEMRVIFPEYYILFFSLLELFHMPNCETRSLRGLPLPLTGKTECSNQAARQINCRNEVSAVPPTPCWPLN